MKTPISKWPHLVLDDVDDDLVLRGGLQLDVEDELQDDVAVALEPPVRIELADEAGGIDRSVGELTDLVLRAGVYLK